MAELLDHMSESAVRHAVAVQRLHRKYRGVFSVSADLAPHGQRRAALYACGREATLARRTASAHWGVWEPRPHEPVEVVVQTTSGRRGPKGLRLHTTTSLPRADVRVVFGLRTTSAARTLIDEADTASDADLGTLLTNTFRKRRIKPRQLDDSVKAAVGRTAQRRLTAILHYNLPELHLTESELEAIFLTLCADAGLPLPTPQVEFGQHRVDFYWPQHRVIIECDSHEWHDNPESFEADKERDLDLEMNGYDVHRLTWALVVNQPEKVVRALRTFLSRSRGYAG